MESTKNTLSCNAPILILILSTVALSTALIAEYMFGLKPCILCLYERIPYIIVIILCSVSLTIKKSKRIMLTLCIITLIGSTALSFYHSGIEYGLFKELSSCTNYLNSSALTLEDLRQQITKNSMPACSEIAFKFLGISMVGWNFLLSLLLLYLSSIGLKDQ